MKQFHIAGVALKGLLLAGLLTSCQNDQTVVPSESTGTTLNDQNAKISQLIRLVDDSGRSLQYVKNGKFFGKLSRANNAAWENSYVIYTYNDNNPTGDLWISKKTYKASDNSFIGEHKFKIVNGLCVQSQNDYGDTFEYKYNAQGYLDEVKKFNQGLLLESWKYQYNLIYWLTKIKHQKDGKPYHTYSFTYKQIEDKYPLNLPTDNIDLNGQHIGGSYIGGINDKYLPYFGKHTSPVIDVMIDKNDVTNQISTGASIYFSAYVVDSDGLVISKELLQYSASWTETSKYSATSWQGLPGNP